MEKILDKEFVKELSECMHDAGFSKEETFKVINERQNKVIKNIVINKLQQIINYIKSDSYDEIKDMLELSPSGDGYGQDNYYISFEEETGYNDLYDICEKLEINNNK